MAVSMNKVRGIASKIPRTPPILPPIKRASRVMIGLNPTALFITTGTIKLFSSCWIIKYKATAANPIKGETAKPKRIAGMACRKYQRLWLQRSLTFFKKHRSW